MSSGVKKYERFLSLHEKGQSSVVMGFTRTLKGTIEIRQLLSRGRGRLARYDKETTTPVSTPEAAMIGITFPVLSPSRSAELLVLPVLVQRTAYTYLDNLPYLARK